METTTDTKKVEARAFEILALKVKPEDGFDGEVLGLVMDIAKLDGEDYTDGSCLDLMLKVISHWYNLTGGSAWLN
jgi:hypothetical protein